MWEKTYVVFPLLVSFESEFGDYAKVVASSLKMPDIKGLTRVKG